MKEWDTYVDPKIAAEVHDNLQKRYNAGEHILPEKKNVFKALQLTKPNEVKVIILGQDPYPDPRLPDGLAFSSKDSDIFPSSLRNIRKEIDSDCFNGKSGYLFNDPNLERWARQGVLLLNTYLTVQAKVPGSHEDVGWQKLTYLLLGNLSRKRKGLAFLLWGAKARRVIPFLDLTGHLTLTAAHPSSLSAHKGFFGCKHFSRANTYLRSHDKAVIDWR